MFHSIRSAVFFVAEKRLQQARYGDLKIGSFVPDANFTHILTSICDM
jgi:hypothetical protein